jgi:hypothetical protein
LTESDAGIPDGRHELRNQERSSAGGKNSDTRYAAQGSDVVLMSTEFSNLQGMFIIDTFEFRDDQGNQLPIEKEDQVIGNWKPSLFERADLMAQLQ